MKDDEQYLSHIYVVRKSKIMKNIAYIEAKIDCICCGEFQRNLRQIFNNPIDFRIREDDSIGDFDIDTYGQHLNYAEPQDVIDFLEKEKCECLRRKPVLSLIKGFDLSAWEACGDKIYIVLSPGWF